MGKKKEEEVGDALRGFEMMFFDCVLVVLRGVKVYSGERVGLQKV